MSTLQSLELVEENNIIQELRGRIKDIISEDAQFQEGFYLYFFLKVSSFSVDKSEKYIRELVQWRKDNKTLKATKVEYIPEIASQFKVASHPKSKSGYPVYQAFAGRFRFRDTIAKHGKESVIYYWMQLLAKAESFIVDWNRGLHKQYGNSVSNWPLSRKSWVILDMASIQYMELLSRDVISIFLALVKMAINYFPAIEGNLIFLNAGRIMEFFFKMIRPMLKGSNIDMYVMGSKDEKYKSFVLEYVDANQLMESFGGILSDDLLL